MRAAQQKLHSVQECDHAQEYGAVRSAKTTAAMGAGE
jgi:hypothetical protein